MATHDAANALKEIDYIYYNTLEDGEALGMIGDVLQAYFRS